MQILKFKKTDPKAIIPRRQTEGAAGFDLHALEAEYLHKTTTPLMVRTGISVEIPTGHVGLIRDRSGLAAKHGVFVLGGVIDSDYTGEMKVLLAKAGEGALNIQPGDRVAQLVIVACPAFEVLEVDSLGETARGENGFGSTGN